MDAIEGGGVRLVTGRWRLSAVLMGLMALGAMFFAWRLDRDLHENKGRLRITDQTGEGGGVVFHWSHPIELPMARRFREAFEAWRDKTDLIIIDLDTAGGAVSEGAAVIELIAKMKRTHQIETHVGPHGSCLSMCVPIYLTGDRRRAARSSWWMFHQPVSYDIFTGERTSGPAFEERLAASKFMRRYFAASPMDPQWRALLEEAWQGGDVWRSGDALYREKANVIQDLY